MKILVSPELFERFPNYRVPMAQIGMWEVDESLKLGQILIEADNGEKYLIELNGVVQEAKRKGGC